MPKGVCNLRPLAKRFWESVLITPSCWLWLGRVNSTGYGQTTQGERHQVLVHRWSYEHFHGPIPIGLVIDHLCRNPQCVNPAHLEAVTQRTNLLRGKGASARNAAKTHCIRGHEFTAENTYIRSGKRQCRICVRLRHEGRVTSHGS